MTTWLRIFDRPWGLSKSRSIYQKAASASINQTADSEAIPLVPGDRLGNSLLLEQFLDWLDGGPQMPSSIEPTLQFQAIIFAAIESAKTGKPVDVQEMLGRAPL